MEKPLQMLHGEIKSPPMSFKARIQSGYLLSELQQGEIPSAPHCKPLKTIGSHCFELRVQDKNVTWRIVVHIGINEVLVLDVFAKKTQKTPQSVISACKIRLRDYEAKH